MVILGIAFLVFIFVETIAIESNLKTTIKQNDTTIELLKELREKSD